MDKQEKKEKIQKILDEELEVTRNGFSGFVSGDLEAVNRIYEEICKDK